MLPNVKAVGDSYQNKVLGHTKKEKELDLLLSSMEVPIELRKILEQSKVYIPCSFLSKIRNQSGLRLPGNRKPRKEYESLLRCSGLSKKHFRSVQYLILNR